MSREKCPVYWGSHGCDLAAGHLGDVHLCLLLACDYSEEMTVTPPYVWQDTGGYCNWWDGQEIGFFHRVCSSSAEYRPDQIRSL